MSEDTLWIKDVEGKVYSLQLHRIKSISGDSHAGEVTLKVEYFSPEIDTAVIEVKDQMWQRLQQKLGVSSWL